MGFNGCGDCVNRLPWGKGEHGDQKEVTAVVDVRGGQWALEITGRRQVAGFGMHLQ